VVVSAVVMVGGGSGCGGEGEPFSLLYLSREVVEASPEEENWSTAVLGPSEGSGAWAAAMVMLAASRRGCMRAMRRNN
jgi:hypothetical protein